MKELIPAEEWRNEHTTRIRNLPDEAVNADEFVLEADLIRAIQRDALKTAANAVCWACGEGIPLDRRHKNTQGDVVHVLDGRGGRWRCDAKRIYKLIPKDPAPEVKP